ncbi:peptidoglycan-binding protein [Spongiibacter sp. KMU-158]|uniref:Peptidoglycan-binding protein n=1 Tax=Spongiibacter pelagi TaxID=2760804 RepID=A0A927GX00_9GAMM|nr:peptidoglycan-binding protein [Spongiibacter pelagi]MBD2860000.1 peptidoglycan-binding protein [Spongiibacter pelagi]
MSEKKYGSAMAVFGSALFLIATSSAHADLFTDQYGNVGYSSAAECDAAVNSGSAKFYKSHTTQPFQLRQGEANVMTATLGSIPGYEQGACDLGAAHHHNRDGVAPELQGKYIPFSPNMDVNAYMDATGNIVRLSMKQCDNNFSGDMPRPISATEKVVAAPQPAPVEVATNDVSQNCFGNVLIPIKYETQYEKVEAIPATKKYISVPATYKTVEQQVMVQAEMIKQIPVPATYKTVEERVMVQAESVRKEPIPATYKTVTEQVLSKPASTKITVIPATFKTVSERVMVKEASTRYEPYPATFKTVTERVQISEAHKVWKRGHAYIGDALEVRPVTAFKVGADGKVQGSNVEQGWFNADNTRMDDDVMCLVEIPAQYKTITKQVLVSPAGVKEITVPAVYQTETRSVIDTPARTEEITIPAEYETVSRQVIDQPSSTRDIIIPARYEMVSRTVIDTPATIREEIIPAVYETVSHRVVDIPASVREEIIPAQYKTLERKVKVAEARTERRAILCDTNATPEKIKEIQTALNAAGFNPGPIDGVMRAKTMKAVNAYQRANDLPVDGYLNLETVKALGISVK